MAEVLASLRAAKKAGTRLILATGRCAPEIYQKVDARLFDVAGLKVALPNSVDELKHNADYIASSSDGEGTIEAVAGLLLGKGDRMA